MADEPLTRRATADHPAVETDALIIGAGPVGLFLAFQLGLLEIACHVVDVLPEAGGQCIALYADKPIYDIPGVPSTTGRALVQSLLAQVAPFRPRFHFGAQVERCERWPDGRYMLETSAGDAFRARSVFIAAGVGAFVPRRPTMDGLTAQSARVRYHPSDLERYAGSAVVVLGGGGDALDTARRLVPIARDVTLLHRRPTFQADAASVAAAEALIASGALHFRAGQPTSIEAGTLHMTTPDGDATTLSLDVLVVCLGLSPRLGPLADWGLALERKQLPVDPSTFETTEPGIYAVGDINTYPGKKKLIVCGFHEATLAAWAASAALRPDQPLPLQYTTTSPRLHALLGVGAKAPAVRS